MVGRWIEGSRDSALAGPGREERVFLHKLSPPPSSHLKSGIYSRTVASGAKTQC